MIISNLGLSGAKNERRRRADLRTADWREALANERLVQRALRV